VCDDGVEAGGFFESPCLPSISVINKFKFKRFLTRDNRDNKNLQYSVKLSLDFLR
jgi:hypothetical protein